MTEAHKMEQAARDPEEDLLQLRFRDDDGSLTSLNAVEMAEVLQGLSELAGDMGKVGLFGDGVPPELRIRPPKEGSFIIEGMLQWAMENPEAAHGMTFGTGAALAGAFQSGVKILRGELEDFQPQENGMVKVLWRNAPPQEIPLAAWNRLRSMKRPTRRALRKIMAPMSEDASSLEVRTGRATETTDEVLTADLFTVATRDDYRTAAYESEDPEEKFAEFDAEAQFTNVNFEGDKWRVVTLHGTRQATIEDQEFLRAVDKGLPLHKNDIFDVTIHETRVQSPGGKTMIEWALTRVERKRRGSDNDDGPGQETPTART